MYLLLYCLMIDDKCVNYAEYIYDLCVQASRLNRCAIVGEPQNYSC